MEAYVNKNVLNIRGYTVKMAPRERLFNLEDTFEKRGY